MRQRRMKGRFVAVLVLAGAMASAAYAFTNTNTFSAGAPNIGDGSASISGYTVSGVGYTLNATNPQNLDQVAFTIAPATAATVKIRLAAAGAWYACVNVSGAVTCNTTVGTQATAVGATQLTVVAVQ